MLTLLLGEMAEMLLTGQRAVPKAAQDLGYSFRYPNISEAFGRSGSEACAGNFFVFRIS